MFENIKNIFKKTKKKEMLKSSSKDAAKERLHLVLMQDRANVSADFLDLMRKEIIEVIKKYIDIDEKAMDVRLTTDTNEDGTQGAPALYANIPIINIKDETRKLSKTNQDKQINNEPTKKGKIDESEETKESKENETENKVEPENINKEDVSKEEIKEDNKAEQEKEDNLIDVESTENQELNEKDKEEKKNEE